MTQLPDLSNLRIDRSSEETPRKRTKYWRLWLWFLLPAIVIVVLWLVLKSVSPAVEVRVAESTSITDAQGRVVLSATGYVVAARKAAVASKATGRLEYLGVEPGDVVRAGEVIARVENEDMKAALDYAVAGLQQAQAESVEAASNFARYQQLLPAKAITQAEFDLAKARYQASLARVKSAAAAVKSAEVALENTYIRAPFDGTVLNKYADVGEIVAPMSSSAGSKAAVVVLADMESLEVEADVSESSIQRVQVGQNCEIILDAYPERRYPGVVKKIVPTADRTRATVLTKIAFLERDERVLPEMSARINFFAADTGLTRTFAGGVAIPNNAVVTRDGQQVVFVVENGRAIQTPVRLGRAMGERVEVTYGLGPGRSVVIDPPSYLNNNNKVKIIP